MIFFISNTPRQSWCVFGGQGPDMWHWPCYALLWLKFGERRAGCFNGENIVSLFSHGGGWSGGKGGKGDRNEGGAGWGGLGFERSRWEGRRTSCGATRRKISKRQNLWSLTGKGLSGLRFCIGFCWNLGNESKGFGDAVELHTWWLELVGLGASLQAPYRKV